jgi:hypothetical protein
VNRELTSATLNATVEVTDEITGSTSKVDVDLTWSGTGSLSGKVSASTSVRRALLFRAG